MKPYYEHGGITIYHGDCREILPSLEPADLILTDPPYSYQHMDGGGFASGTKFYREGALDGLCDFDLGLYAAILAKNTNQIIAFHSRDQIRDWATFCYEQFGHYDLHAWYKSNAIPFTHNTWKSDLEYIAVGWRGTKQHVRVDQRLKSKLFLGQIETESFHPAAKPVCLLEKYLIVLAPKITIDPFMGSGSTLVAAKQFRPTRHRNRNRRKIYRRSY